MDALRGTLYGVDIFSTIADISKTYKEASIVENTGGRVLDRVS